MSYCDSSTQNGLRLLSSTMWRQVDALQCRSVFVNLHPHPGDLWPRAYAMPVSGNSLLEGPQRRPTPFLPPRYGMRMDKWQDRYGRCVLAFAIASAHHFHVVDGGFAGSYDEFLRDFRGEIFSLHHECTSGVPCSERTINLPTIRELRLLLSDRETPCRLRIKHSAPTLRLYSVYTRNLETVAHLFTPPVKRVEILCRDFTQTYPPYFAIQAKKRFPHLEILALYSYGDATSWCEETWGSM